MPSDRDRPAGSARDHQSYDQTKARAVDMLRREGIPRERAERIADQAARRTHDTLDRTK